MFLEYRPREPLPAAVRRFGNFSQIGGVVELQQVLQVVDDELAVVAESQERQHELEPD